MGLVGSCAASNHCGLLMNGSTGNADRATTGNCIADRRAANGNRTTDNHAASSRRNANDRCFVLVDHCSADSDLTVLQVTRGGAGTRG